MGIDTEHLRRSADVRHAMRQYAKHVLGRPEEPSPEDYRGYFAIAQALPTPDFSANFERERAANTPLYQEAVRDTRRLIDETQIRMEANALLADSTPPVRGSQRVRGQTFRGFIDKVSRFLRR